MTQAFYPLDRPRTTDIWEELIDDDRKRVREMFLLINDVVRELGGQLQVIATDHARIDEPWFLEAIRADWHSGEGLVPESWISDEYRQP
jgi:hypothetical protein